MNAQHIKTLVSLLILFSLPLSALEITDPGESQKEAIARMHHKLHDDQAAHEAREAKALKELNEMTIRENVRVESINNKIDELIDAKKQVIRLRYFHLIEMRTILTDEQKVGYDKAVLNRSTVK